MLCGINIHTWLTNNESEHQHYIQWFILYLLLKHEFMLNSFIILIYGQDLVSIYMERWSKGWSSNVDQTIHLISVIFLGIHKFCVSKKVLDSVCRIVLWHFLCTTIFWWVLILCVNHSGCLRLCYWREKSATQLNMQRNANGYVWWMFVSQYNMGFAQPIKYLDYVFIPGNGVTGCAQWITYI